MALNTTGVTTAAIDAAGSISTAIQVIIIALILGGVIGWIAIRMGYKHRVIIRELTNKNKIITFDKAKNFKDPNGVSWWKLLKLKKNVTEPPGAVIGISKRGKKVAEAYLLPGGNIAWANDTINESDLLKDGSVVETIKPLDTQERALYVNELHLSEDYKKTGVVEWLAKVAPYAAIIMILLIFMLFFGEVLKPAQDMAATYRQTSLNLERATASLENIVADRMSLTSEGSGSDISKPPPN